MECYALLLITGNYVSKEKHLSPSLLVDLQAYAFIAAVVLLLNIWSGKRLGRASNHHREMQGVQRCMEILKVSERRQVNPLHIFREALTEIYQVGLLRDDSGLSAFQKPSMTIDRCLYSDILRQLASAGDLSILDNGQSQEVPRKKRSRDADSDLSDISPQACPDPTRSMAGTRRVSTSLPSYVQQRQESPNFSLPMYSNELRRLPVYGEFQFSHSVVPSLPVQSLDVDLIPGLMGTSYDMQGTYATNPLFEGQMMGDLIDHNGTPETPYDFATPYSGDSFDIDVLSSFGGATPAMDNTTMAVWSAAPTNFEYVFSFFSNFLSSEAFLSDDSYVSFI